MSIVERLRALKEGRKQYADATALDHAICNDQELRAEISYLAKAILNEQLRGCNDCYRRAYFSLIYFDDEAMVQEKQDCVFHLKAGALLKDVNGDHSKMMSQHNITNELAVYHLTTNPHCRRFFDAPADLDAAIAQFTTKAEQPKATAKKVAKKAKK